MSTTTLPPATQTEQQRPKFSSLHTPNLPSILQQIGSTLLVSTYQAGMVITVRAESQGLNTHFCTFQRAMGIAADPEKIAIGTTHEILELRNLPGFAKQLDPPDQYDACFFPRKTHITGDIDVHEMAYIGEELWFVNTRFSCLCTLDGINSFTPRWRPSFITEFDPSDRCHLNGLGIRSNQVRYVTALGKSNKPRGWRQNKFAGGILMDVITQAILADGLCMPHSPRWYKNELYFLESGYGSLAKVDLQTREKITIAQLPGFTRGLAIYADLAFIGLSKVRESGFASVPIPIKPEERGCGVWVVNIKTGETVAFLKFEDAVEEIFAVNLLSQIQFPEIMDRQSDRLKDTYVLPQNSLSPA